MGHTEYFETYQAHASLVVVSAFKLFLQSANYVQAEDFLPQTVCKNVSARYNYARRYPELPDAMKSPKIFEPSTRPTASSNQPLSSISMMSCGARGKFSDVHISSFSPLNRNDQRANDQDDLLCFKHVINEYAASSEVFFRSNCFTKLSKTFSRKQ